MSHLGDHRHHQSCGCRATGAAGDQRGFLQSLGAFAAAGGRTAIQSGNALRLLPKPRA